MIRSIDLANEAVIRTIDLVDETVIRCIFYRRTPSCTKQICQMQKRHLVYRNGKHRAGKHLCSVCLFIHTEAFNAHCVDGVPPPMAYGVNYVGVCKLDKRYEFINGSLLL